MFQKILDNRDAYSSAKLIKLVETMQDRYVNEADQHDDLDAQMISDFGYALVRLDHIEQVDFELLVRDAHMITIPIAFRSLFREINKETLDDQQ